MSKKPARAKKQNHAPRKKNRGFKGGLGAGTLYAVVALLVVALGGSLMVGNITPNTSSEDPEYLKQFLQPVIVSPPILEPSQANLQLQEFPGVTLTVTPPPPAPPQPQQEWENSAKKKKEGKGEGGSSNKPGGGGSGSGGGNQTQGKAR
jgi:uncharacterized membrane protein YgcG